jgi:hypothetical protein
MNNARCTHYMGQCDRLVCPRENARRTIERQRIEEETIASMMRELQSDLARQVEAGDMTDEQANEWANMKADQWARGLS